MRIAIPGALAGTAKLIPSDLRRVGVALVEVAERMDAYGRDQALAVFLCAPQALYAVNNDASFGLYKTTFEIAEVTADGGTGRVSPARLWRRRATRTRASRMW